MIFIILMLVRNVHTIKKHLKVFMYVFADACLLGKKEENYSSCCYDLPCIESVQKLYMTFPIL